MDRKTKAKQIPSINTSQIMSHHFLRWVKKSGKSCSKILPDKKNFFNIQRIDLKSLLATQLGSSNIWQKFQDDWLTRFFGKLCTNLKNHENRLFWRIFLNEFIKKNHYFSGRGRFFKKFSNLCTAFRKI